MKENKYCFICDNRIEEKEIERLFEKKGSKKMGKILPNVKKRTGSVKVNLHDPEIYKEYVEIARTFKEQVRKRIREREKRELEAEKRVKDIIINY